MIRFSSTASLLMCVVTGFTLFTGCSSASKNHESPGKAIELSSEGPTVLNARSEPQVITLNRDLQPNRPGEVIADVKDLKSPVTDVKVQFKDLPLEVPMERVGGSTWRAELTPQQIQMLAVSGKTVKYKATVIAKDDQGVTAQSHETIEVAVQAPDLGSGIG
jgi:hypothetical protein